MKKLLILLLIVFLGFLPSRTFAQTQLRNDSNTVTTTVGTGGTQNGASLAAAATELATVIGKACNGAVTGNNVDKCLNGLHFQNVPNPELASGAISNSAKNIYCDDNDKSKGTCLQCVGFVVGVVGGTTGQNFSNGGDASTYATNVPSGYTYIKRSSGTPVQIGDIIVKTGGPGHIAVVTQTSATQTGTTVAEANYDLAGGIQIKGSQLALWDGWLRKQ